VNNLYGSSSPNNFYITEKNYKKIKMNSMFLWYKSCSRWTNKIDDILNDVIRKY
jgi:hypothetical protein